ncbi:MAG TPA: isochorismatase family cysteine hydrolase [Alphaproteobacteria bacterium]|nr:isochorismatase family cysteine hydrolase [Alphaproteobacteria bacterium]
MSDLGAGPLNRWRIARGRVDLTRAAPEPRIVETAAEPASLRLDLNRTAILVIDMQNDFCAPGGWMDRRGVDLAAVQAPMAPLKKLLPALRRAGVPVIWLNWGIRPDLLSLPPNLLYAGGRKGASLGYGARNGAGKGRFLVRGSWGAEIVAALAPSPRDIRVEKSRFSGFWHSELDAILRNLGVTTLLFAGVNLDRCVLATLQDASFLGYDCVLVEDCAATSSPAFCTEATRFLVRELYGFILRSGDLIAGLGRSRARARRKPPRSGT